MINTLSFSFSVEPFVALNGVAASWLLSWLLAEKKK